MMRTVDMSHTVSHWKHEEGIFCSRSDQMELLQQVDGWNVPDCIMNMYKESECMMWF